ncbi:stalk domain-containing protein [Schinkia azotoformans]|uniref:stalk domain-containing protein n=1 Tax=Schinkia azotoformans TaxID=1454 RepID=UPI002DB7DB72|nr:stalk domain-containing protein [Schinkia azotoformans]
MKYIQILVVLALVLFGATTSFAHPGKLDKNGGHNCTESAKAKGLCTEYHYHNEGSTDSKLTSISVFINGAKQTYEQPPLIENGTTLVPLRGIFESLNATVTYDSKTRVIQSQKEATKVTLTLGSKVATVNGKSETLAVPAKAINGRTLVPLRFVSQALGAVVNWDATNKKITITADDSSPTNVNTFDATIIGNVDGDTLKISYGNNKEETIRLLLVDTPETVHPSKPVQPFGKEASELAKQMMPVGSTVKVELDVGERDKYGRLLAYVYVEDKMFNEVLLEKGLARVAYVYAPNTKYVDRFREIETKAKQQGVGIWSIENYVQEDGFHSN